MTRRVMLAGMDGTLLGALISSRGDPLDNGTISWDQKSHDEILDDMRVGLEALKRNDARNFEYACMRPSQHYVICPPPGWDDLDRRKQRKLLKRLDRTGSMALPSRR